MAQSIINLKRNKRKGFSLAEVLIAGAVLLIFITTFSSTIIQVKNQLTNSFNRERAISLADEGLEAARNIRDNNFFSLNDGVYGLTNSNNQFNFAGTNDTTDIFNRTVNITTLGNNQKRIDVTVEWQDIFSPDNSVTLSTYLTNWRAPLSIGLTIDKVVINHGGTKVASDFLPYDLSTQVLDSTVDPPVLQNIDIPINFSPATMNLVSGTYTFTTTSDPDYDLSLSPDCNNGTIILAEGDAKLCVITYEEKIVNVVPTISSPTANDITYSTATLGANLVDLGIPALISERGTCWGTTANPTTNCVAEGGNTIGVFAQNRTGFSPGTLYYYRGYAINTTGTAYSEDGTFSTTDICSTALIGTPTVYNSAGSTSAVINKPTGVAQNDIMFAHILHFNSTDRLNSIPSGWNLIGRHKNGNYNQALYYKVAGADEPTTYTFGLSASSKFGITISSYRGCFDAINPIGASSNIEYVVNNTTYRADSLDLISPYTNVLMFPSIYSTAVRTFANPLTQDGGWSEDYDHGATSSDFSRAGYRKLINSIGPTGVIDSIGRVGNTIKHAFAVALNPF